MQIVDSVGLSDGPHAHPVPQGDAEVTVTASLVQETIEIDFEVRAPENRITGR